MPRRGVPGSAASNTNNARPISADASNKAINDRINRLRKSMVSNDDDIQDIILMGVTHSTGIGNGDVTWAARLVNAIPKTYRRALVKNYLEQHTMIRFTSAGKDAPAGTFKASVKEGESLAKINAARAALPEDNEDWLRVPLSWEHTKYVVGKYPDDFEDEELRGKWKHPFFEEPAVHKEPGMYGEDQAKKDLQAFIERLNKTIDGKVKSKQAADIPALRGLIASLKKLEKDFRDGKIAAINDDNTMTNRSTTDEVTRKVA